MPSYTNLFCTVGTTRFDTLCKQILTSETISTLKSIGCKNLTVQIGSSDMEPLTYSENGIQIHTYRLKDSIHSDIEQSDLVISHAGAGTCLEVLDAGKPLLVVINEELMDNHQVELAEQLHMDGHLYYCTCDTLNETLKVVDFEMLKPLPKPDISGFKNFLDSVFVVKS